MKNTAVVEQRQELMVVDLGQNAGAGLEDMSMDEMLTPFLRILQKGSPQVDPAMPEQCIEEARPGMIFNTATQELYSGKDGVEIVVCARDHHYGSWVPRDSGGGFRGMFKPNDPAVLKLRAQHGKFKKLPYMMDNEAVHLVETIQFYVLYAAKDLDEFNAQRAIISFTSTAMPVAQMHLTRHMNWKYRQSNGTSSPAQLWSYKWLFTLVPQQNAMGSWFNWRTELLPRGGTAIQALIKPTDELWRMGEEFYQLYRSGGVMVDQNAGGSAATGGAFDSDEIPL